ncbi:AfsR/SARP family transcriptional regulator [Streptomyces sp. GQFP]|uniref:AfsR/SARP family transcriptional regulator n=1 Tax=Streptomyces sp. GQFP TaxID=2907545 RepID=UPI001F34DD0F|nr:AfsR/SARP family transcriptional regulator [Streptomyces sp. GQFP]UIX31000.1 AfsR/SARP family transcriptional regulator [Streptomyces sp. GQFP]
MNIQLLGCIEVRTPSGSRVSMSNGVGLLLAATAWTPNVFVADDEVIERLWETRLPEHPRNALHTLATRVRKALRCVTDDGGPGFDLIRRYGGYILAVDEEVVDASRFRRLVRQAKDAERRGEAERALGLYEEALALWRGEPLSNMRTAWADAARLTLRHEHRNAVIGGAELSLRLGRYDECVAPLHELAARQPLDEWVVGLLMLALYRSGRQEEALRCFQVTRTHMVELLGDEPGPELRSVHERILCRSESLRPYRGVLDLIRS